MARCLAAARPDALKGASRLPWSQSREVAADGLCIRMVGTEAFLDDRQRPLICLARGFRCRTSA